MSLLPCRIESQNQEWRRTWKSFTFVTEDQESVDFYIIEETRVNGINYLLVTESEDEEDEEAEAYILKDTSKAEDTEAVYEFVESEEELDAVSRILPSYWKTWI